MTALTAIRNTADAEPVAGQWTARSRDDFESTLTGLKAAINARDLWLIAEIDPQMLSARAGLAMPPARQLLCFHPRYLQRLLQADARALPEVPIKIVVMTDASGQVVLRGPDLRIALARYSGTRALGEELAVQCAGIVATVAQAGEAGGGAA